MNKFIFGTIIYVLAGAIPAQAKEGVSCDYYYENIQRKENIIKSYGDDLSPMAKTKLFQDLASDTKGCISECEGQKFKYCNEIAKWISE